VDLAARLDGIPANETRQLVDDVERYEAAGHPVLSFLVGRPDFDTPVHIKEAASQALDDGFVHYVHSRGIPDLRAAISGDLARRSGLSYDPSSDIVVTAGVAAALSASFYALIEPGDEVLIPEPAWNSYRWAVRLAGGVPVGVPLSPADQFNLNPDDLERAASLRTRMVIVNSPHNPTGAVWGRERLLDLARLADRRDLLIICDEIYDHFVYSKEEHISVAALPGMRERTIVVNGFSKTYSMTGWRLGYVAGPARLVDGIMRIQQYFLSCVNSFAQKGGVAALTQSQERVDEMVAEFRRRRDLVVAKLGAIPGVDLVPPRGAFYAFPSFERFGLSSLELAQTFLREAHVALVPGRAFGAAGEGYLRLAFTRPFGELEEGLDRLAAACATMHRGTAARAGTAQGHTAR
jgi:aspartate/methionine/tyrosine aminotransferase